MILDYGKIENCHNYCNVTGLSCVGGIVGYSKNIVKFLITNCSNYGQIKFRTEDGSFCGGIIGNTDSINMIISNCYNAGKITDGAGIVANSKGTIINCYNTGESKEGLVGNNQGKIYNSYSIANATNKSLISHNIYTNSYIEKCYYLEGTANKVAQNYNEGTIDELSTSLEESEMKSEDFLNILNSCTESTYSNNWKKDINNINKGYPILNWQN